MLKISTPPLTVNCATGDLFYYQNRTSQIQVIRIDQAVPKWEKVVFPGDRILFYATPEALLEIYASTSTELTLLDRIFCSQLQVFQP